MCSWGRGGDQVVSVLTFYSKDPSSNTAEANSFFSVKFVLEKNENKQGRGRGWTIFLKNTRCVCSSCSTKYLSPLIVLGLGVTFLTLILPSHTKAIAWMRQQKTEVLVEKNTLKWGRLRVTTLTILLLTKHGIFLH